MKMKKKATKATKKRTKKQVQETVEKLNRGGSLINDNEPEKADCKSIVNEEKPVQEKEKKPLKKSKYMVISEYIKQHNGEYNRQELLDILEKECGIVKGTSTAALSDFKSSKYKPVWLTENLIEENGKIFLRWKI